MFVSSQCDASQELLAASVWGKNMPGGEANMEDTEPRKEGCDGLLMLTFNN